MASIVDTLRDVVPPDGLSDLSAQTGESEAALGKGFSAATSAIAASIASRCDDRRFMTDVAAISSKAAAYPDFLATTPADSWLSVVLGSNLSGLAASIAVFAGLNESTAESVLLASCRRVFSGFGRVMRADGLDGGGLAARLCQERTQLVAALPAGFELPESLRAPVKAARTVVDRAAPRRRVRVTRAPMASGWTVPLLALLAVGIGALIGWVAHEPGEQTQAQFGESAGRAVGTAGTIGGRFARALPGNVVITIPPGSAEDRLSNYLGSARNGETTINLDRIAFDDGSAVLTQESRDQIDNIATILRAYPAASVIVAGYTDKGDAEDQNLRLSRARAEAVASRLIAAGLASERVRADGYGSRSPLADNATEEGRSQNRRIALDVTVR